MILLSGLFGSGNGLLRKMNFWCTLEGQSVCCAGNTGAMPAPPPMAQWPQVSQGTSWNPKFLISKIVIIITNSQRYHEDKRCLTPVKVLQNRNNKLYRTLYLLGNLHGWSLLIFMMTLWQNYYYGASLVMQWLRIHLPMQGTWVRALGREDPTCRGATKPVRHNYWAHVPQLPKPTHLEPVLCNKRSHRDEKPTHCNEE